MQGSQQLRTSGSLAKFKRFPKDANPEVHTTTAIQFRCQTSVMKEMHFIENNFTRLNPENQKDQTLKVYL